MKANKNLLFLIFAVILWGAVVPIMKITLREVPIFTLVVLRMGVASLLLLPFVIKNLKIKKEDFKNVILAAIFGTNLNLMFFFFGLEHASAINASVLVATAPVFTLAFAHFFLHEKLSAKLIFGSLLSLTGVIIIVGIPAFESSLWSTLANLSLITSSLAWVGHEIFSKKLLKTYTSNVVAFYTMAIGAIMFIPLSALEFFKNPQWIYHLSASGFFGLMYGIIFASLIAYVLWQKGLAFFPASMAEFIFYLLPIFGIIFSIILLHEKFNLTLITGSVFILIGIVIGEYYRKNTSHNQ